MTSQVDQVKRALERGGLPKEAEVEMLSKSLTRAHDELEVLTWRVEGVAESDVGDDLPSTISLEELGALMVLMTDLDRRFEEMSELKRRIEQSLFALTAIRGEQVARALASDAR